MSETTVQIQEHEFSLQARQTIEDLTSRTAEIFADIERQKFWNSLLSPTTPNEQVKAFVREVFFSIFSYQRHTTEAGFLMISRLPKSEHKLISALTHHKLDEAEHGQWALRDYLLLGGPEEPTRQPASPATFAVASIWWRMAMVEDPFGYLGAEFLFEYLTILACGPVIEQFKRRGFKMDGFGFIVDHATEDIKHTNLLRYLVGYTVTKFPESRQSMMRCFDYFAHVYPIPVWTEAFARAEFPTSAVQTQLV